MASDSLIVSDEPPTLEVTARAPSISPRRAARAPLAPPGALPHLVIQPRGGWRTIDVAELWQFRELLWFLIWRDVQVRYKQTLLGAAWAVLQPALMMVVFTIFFGRLAQVSSGDLPYPVFVYAGLLPWTFFATALTQAANSVVSSERLITKVYFPRLVIPLAAVGAALVDFFTALGLLALLAAWYGVQPGLALIAAQVIMLGFVLAAAGVGTLLAALNVAYRDFRYVIPFLIQIWMFATPTIYMNVAGQDEGAMSFLLAANPLSTLVAAFRGAMLGGLVPWTALGMALAMCAALFLFGCFFFTRVEDSFSDII